MTRTICMSAWAGLIFALLSGTPGRASIVVSVSPATQTVQMGDSFTVDVQIAGLGNFTAPSLGLYNVGLLYDDAILELLVPPQPGPYLGHGTGDSSFSFLIGPGTGFVVVGESSLLAPAALNALQPDTFVLFQSTFRADAFGVSPLTLELNLADEDGAPLESVVANGSVSVAAVPEPSSLATAGIFTLIGLIIAWRRRISSATPCPC